MNIFPCRSRFSWFYFYKYITRGLFFFLFNWCVSWICTYWLSCKSQLMNISYWIQSNPWVFLHELLERCVWMSFTRFQARNKELEAFYATRVQVELGHEQSSTISKALLFLFTYWLYISFGKNETLHYLKGKINLKRKSRTWQVDKGTHWIDANHIDSGGCRVQFVSSPVTIFPKVVDLFPLPLHLNRL